MLAVRNATHSLFLSSSGITLLCSSLPPLSPASPPLKFVYLEHLVHLRYLVNMLATQQPKSAGEMHEPSFVHMQTKD